MPYVHSSTEQHAVEVSETGQQEAGRNNSGESTEAQCGPHNTLPLECSVTSADCTTGLGEENVQGQPADPGGNQLLSGGP